MIFSIITISQSGCDIVIDTHLDTSVIQSLILEEEKRNPLYDQATYGRMITAGIRHYEDERGSSIFEIAKYLNANFDFPRSYHKNHLHLALKQGVKSGAYVLKRNYYKNYHATKAVPKNDDEEYKNDDEEYKNDNAEDKNDDEEDMNDDEEYCVIKQIENAREISFNNQGNGDDISCDDQWEYFLLDYQHHDYPDYVTRDEYHKYYHDYNPYEFRDLYYPFTNNKIANILLTERSISWDDTFLEDGSCELMYIPIRHGQLFKLWKCNRQKKYNFVKNGKWNLDNTENMNDTINTIKNMLNRLDNLSNWELTYLVIELDISNLLNEEKYSYGLWNLIDDNKSIKSNTSIPTLKNISARFIIRSQ